MRPFDELVYVRMKLFTYSKSKQLERCVTNTAASFQTKKIIALLLPKGRSLLI
jgi:hypothetical protein